MKPCPGDIITAIDDERVKVRILSARRAPRRSFYNMHVVVVESNGDPAFKLGGEFPTISSCWKWEEES